MALGDQFSDNVMDRSSPSVQYC